MFQKAQKKVVKLRLAITGPSGAGKTYSALRLAKGFGGTIAFIDTESGSASLYSDKFDFDVLELKPPFTTEKYIEAIRQAQKLGYDILIIDSISHVWAAEGGLLQQKEILDGRGGNPYTNWNMITKKHEAFRAAILHSSIHVIATMRSKQDYVFESNEKGKSAPRKIGLAPIQREGMEYEFTTVFDVVMSHEATASKDRSEIFDDRMFRITEDTGIEIKNWLLSKSAPADDSNLLNEEYPIYDSSNIDHKRALGNICSELGLNIKDRDSHDIQLIKSIISEMIKEKVTLDPHLMRTFIKMKIDDKECLFTEKE